MTDEPRSFRWGPVTAAIYGGTDFWLRIFGRGVSVQRPAHPDGYIPFSERNGYRKAWHVGDACIKWLSA